MSCTPKSALVSECNAEFHTLRRDIECSSCHKQ